MSDQQRVEAMGGKRFLQTLLPAKVVHPRSLARLVGSKVVILAEQSKDPYKRLSPRGSCRSQGPTTPLRMSWRIFPRAMKPCHSKRREESRAQNKTAGLSV